MRCTITRNAPIITAKGNTDPCDQTSLDKLTSELKTKHVSNSLSLVNGRLLLWNAYKTAAKKPITKFPTTKEALTYQLAKYEHQPIDSSMGNVDELRSFIFYFYFSGCYNEFWDKLDEEGKVEFNLHLYSFIFAYLTGITPLNGRLLLELYNRDQIIEHSGLMHAGYNEDTKNFILYFKDGSILEAKYLIDVSGFSYHATNPLLECLSRKGIIVPKKLGGIEVTDCYQAINKNHDTQLNLFLMGPTVSYAHPVPTAYSSFHAREAGQKAMQAIDYLFKTNVEEENLLMKFTLDLGS